MSMLIQHRHSVFTFILKQVGNAADAEDVYQRTSLSLWKKKDAFEVGGNFYNWACGFAFNEVRNYRTRQRRNRLRFDAELAELIAAESESMAARADASLEALRGCMKQLSQRQQEILQRCFSSTESMTDVAASLDRSRGAFYKQIARLKSKLSACIDQVMNRCEAANES